MTATSRKKFDPGATRWILLALGVALVLGVYGYQSRADWVRGLATIVQPFGTLWLNALQMTVVPLIVAQLLAGIVGMDGDSPIRSIGMRALGVFAGGLFLAGVATALIAPLFIRLYSIAPESVAAMQAAVVVPESAAQAVSAAPETLGEWLTSLLPTNVFESATSNQILPILIVTVLFGLAASRLPAEHRAPLGRLFRAVAEAMMVLIHWILLATPIGVFAFVVGITLNTGAELVGMLGMFVLTTCGSLIIITIAVYPVAALLGRASISAFARAAAPAQAIGFGTRSSLAALPAHIEGGSKHLHFSEATNAFTVPLCVSVFKLNTPISMMAKGLFLTHVFGVAVGTGALVTFIITSMFLSLSSIGVPRGGTPFRGIPAYVALGIPLEGYLILEAVRDITDFFQTTANVTGHAAAATILSRGDRSRTKAGELKQQGIVSAVGEAG